MDGYKGKRAAGRFSFSKRGNNLSFRDPTQEDRSIQYCNQLGCSTRLNSMKGTQLGTQEKLKYPKSPFRSTNSKTIAGSSSRSRDPSRKRELEDIRYCKGPELIEDSDSSSIQGETDGSEFGLAASNIQMIPDDSEELESPILQGTSSSRPHKQLNRRLGSSKPDSSSSSARPSLVSRNATHTTKPTQGTIAGMVSGAPRYRLKNLGCTSISDILPSGCSSSELGQTRRINSTRKKHGGEESSSSNGARGASGPVSGLSGLLSERSLSQQTARRVRNQAGRRDGAVSVRTRWAPSGGSGARSPEQDASDIITPPEAVMIPRLPQDQFPLPEPVPESSSRSFLAELPPVFHNTFGRSTNTSWSARTRMSSRLEDNSMEIFRGPSGERDRYRRNRTEGIAEVLLALERIEIGEELLTYEQLLMLKTNLILGGLSLHDQHRDMRMDIDNMSYEELLALEEKMGTVSTAVSQEALGKCLRRSIYAPAPDISGQGDEIKCSICQEEYYVGDEVGKLACEHGYHVACIHEWLRQKNWCPVCKGSVSAS